MPIEAVRQRGVIRKAVCEGDVETAIEMVKAINPEVCVGCSDIRLNISLVFRQILKARPDVHYQLQLLHLVELIK